MDTYEYTYCYVQFGGKMDKPKKVKKTFVHCFFCSKEKGCNNRIFSLFIQKLKTYHRKADSHPCVFPPQQECMCSHCLVAPTCF